MLKKIKLYFNIIKLTFENFSKDNCFRLSAALSYYTIISLAPLLIIIIAIASLFFGAQAATGEIYNQINHYIGQEAAAALQKIIENSYQTQNNKMASLLGLAAMIFAATTVFFQLQKSLNAVWNVKAKPKTKKRGLLKVLKDRLLSFGLILAIGFLLLVSFIANAILVTLVSYFAEYVPLDLVNFGRVIEIVLSLIMVAVLFALIFKYLPDVKVPWKVVWVGSVVTALLFNVGKYLIGFYLAKSSLASIYGSAGTLVVILIWVYYSSLIFFLGAEFTQAHAQCTGETILPKDYAVKTRVTEIEGHVPSQAIYSH